MPRAEVMEKSSPHSISFHDGLKNELGCAHRGMVVTVYLDPISHHESTAEKLKKLEDGGFGPFYRS